MNKATLIAAAIFAGVFPFPVGAAEASDFDRSMEPVLAEYLKIQTALAADETEGIEGAVGVIQGLAKALDPGAPGKENAETQRNIRAGILAACVKFRGAKDIAAMREAFRALSKPLSLWVTTAEPKEMSVMYCPMKKAGWVQRGSKVANPYYGSEMPSCGEKVGGAD